MRQLGNHGVVLLVGGALAGAALIGAEAAGPDDQGAAAGEMAVQAVPQDSPEGESVSARGMQLAVEAALADAERRTTVPKADLKLVSAEVVTWTDGSLGCPSPGVMYTQAMIPGYRIRLRADEANLDYHASARGRLVLCPAGRAVEPIQGEAM